MWQPRSLFLLFLHPLRLTCLLFIVLAANALDPSTPQRGAAKVQDKFVNRFMAPERQTP